MYLLFRTKICTARMHVVIYAQQHNATVTCFRYFNKCMIRAENTGYTAKHLFFAAS